MSANWTVLENQMLSAAINPLGAELSSLKDADGRELMTDGDPTWWTGRAPLLFPIVGTVNGDRYVLDGQTYALPRHGFARRQTFALIEQAPHRALFRLTDSEATRAAYPFAFTLDAEFALDGATLGITITATNRSDTDMPASFGFHPGFRWPLPYGGPREAHCILFETDEPADLRVLADGLVDPMPRPTPVEGRVLALRDDLFEADALIWDRLASRSLVYGAEGYPSLGIEWDDMPELGIWTKPGAPYVCIEPWAGVADPVGFSGEIWDKPGIVRVAPGQSQNWAMRVTLTGA
jgi:galactose mutarotase-like enzyme